MDAVDRGRRGGVLVSRSWTAPFLLPGGIFKSDLVCLSQHRTCAVLYWKVFALPCFVGFDSIASRSVVFKTC